MTVINRAIQKTKLGFNNSATATWVFTPKDPCIARFGKHLYEVKDAQSEMYFSGPTIKNWRNFCAELLYKTGSILTDHAMPLDLWSQAFELGLVRTKTPSFSIDVNTLANHINPYICNPWNETPFSLEDVEDAVKKRRFARKPVEIDDGVEAQIKRIAYLATTPEQWTPINLSFSHDGDVKTTDGNHRIAAAIYLQKRKIEIVFEGFSTSLENLFPGALPTT